MFNRLQSRRASSLQRLASINPASYEPFSSLQFGALVAEELSQAGLNHKVVSLSGRDQRVFLSCITASGEDFEVEMVFGKDMIKVIVITNNNPKGTEFVHKIGSYLNCHDHFDLIAGKIDTRLSLF
jgi:hypothetical protein